MVCCADNSTAGDEVEVPRREASANREWLDDSQENRKISGCLRSESVTLSDQFFPPTTFATKATGDCGHKSPASNPNPKKIRRRLRRVLRRTAFAHWHEWVRHSSNPLAFP